MKLQRRRKLDTVVKDAFWLAVRDCLTDLFTISMPGASKLCQDRRAAVDLVPHHLRSNIYYHREPFDVATDLAKTTPPSAAIVLPSLDNPQTSAAYEVILNRHGLL